MLDKGKVIKGIHDARKYLEDREWVDKSVGVHIDALNDALALLKEQEAVEPYMDYDGQDVWRCGKCGNSLMHPAYYESGEDPKNYIRYCSHCGKAVKWK